MIKLGDQGFLSRERIVKYIRTSVKFGMFFVIVAYVFGVFSQGGQGGLGGTLSMAPEQAHATVGGQATFYFHKELSDVNETYNALSLTPPEPAVITTSGTPATNTFASALCEASTNTGETLNKVLVINNSAAHEGCIASFISDPVGQAITVSVGDTAPTANKFYGFDSATTVAGTWKIYIYKYSGGVLSAIATLSSSTDPGNGTAALTFTSSAITGQSLAATDRIAMIATKSFTSTGTGNSGLLFDSTADTTTNGGPANVVLKYTAITPNKPSLAGTKDDDFVTSAATTACSGTFNTKWTCTQGGAANSAGDYNNATAAPAGGDTTNWLWIRNKITASSTVSNFGSTPSNTFMYQSVPSGYGDGDVSTVVNSSTAYTVGATNPTAPYNHGGLVLWTSNTDYIEMQVYADAAKAGGGQTKVALDNCTSSCTGNNGTITSASIETSSTQGVYGRIWLRFTKSGTNYQGAYSVDGSSWTNVGSAVAHATEFGRVGLNAYSGIGGLTNQYAAAFEWFKYTLAAPTISIGGTCVKANESTACDGDDGTNAFKVAVNGTLQGQSDTVIDGSWSITGVPQPSSGDVITVFIDGTADASEAVGVTKYDGTGNISGIDLIWGSLSIGSDDNQTLTNANLGSYDGSVSADEDIFFDYNAGSVTCDGRSFFTGLCVDYGNSNNGTGQYTNTEQIYIKTGNIFAPGGNVLTAKLDIAGTYTGLSETLFLTGAGTTNTTCTATTDMPLCKRTAGTFTPNVNYVVYVSSSSTKIACLTYYTLYLFPDSGTPTYTLCDGAGQTLTFSTLEFTNLSSFIVDGSTYNPTMNGSNISSDSFTDVFNTGTGTITLSNTTAPLINYGTINATTGNTFIFTGSSSTPIDCSVSYYNVMLKPNGASDQVLCTNTSQTFTVTNDLTIGDGTHAGATGTANDPTINVGGSLTVASGATFTVPDAASNNITIGGSLTLGTTSTWTKSTTSIITFGTTANTVTITDNKATKQNLGFVTIGNGTIAKVVNLGSDIKVAGLTVTNGSTFSLNGTHALNLSGSVTLNSASTFTKSTGSVNFTDGAAATITDSNATKQDLGPISIGTGCVSQTVTLGSDAKITSVSFACGGAALDFNGSKNLEITATSGNGITLGAGTFTSSTGTVTFTAGSGTVGISSAAITFYNLTLNGAGTFTGSNGNGFTVKNELKVLAGTLSLSGDTFTIGSTAVTNSGSLKIASGASLTSDNLSSIIFTSSSGGTNCIGANSSDCTGTAGTFTAGANWYFAVDATPFTTNLAATNATYTSGNLQVHAGHTFNAGSSTIILTQTGSALFGSGTFNANTSTVKYTSTGAATIAPYTYYNLTIDPGSATAHILGTAASQTISVTNDLVIGGSFSGSTVQGTTNTPTLTIARDFTVSANSTFSAPPSVTIGRNFTNSGTFTNNSGLVTLNSASTATVDAGTSGTTFYDLTITHSAAKEVDFATTSTKIVHVTHTFTVTGHTAALIKLYSTSAGTKWHFHPTGTAVVDYADVKDGGCETGAITITPTNSTNSLNNDSCWSFPVGGITISGSANGNNAATVKVAINGSVAAAQSGGVIGSSAWTLTGVTTPSTGDIITVWVDGVTDANESTAVAKYDGTSNITGMVLNTNVLTIGSTSDGSESLTLASLDFYDCANDEDVMHRVNGTALEVEGHSTCAGSVSNSYTDETINILASYTLTVGTTESLTTDNVSVASSGFLVSTGNASYSVSGDWTNSGTFTKGTSTVTMTGTSTVSGNMSGSSAFNNLTLNGSAATFTLGSGTLEVDGNFVLGNGSNTMTVTAATNNTAINLLGDLTIAANVTYTKAGSSKMTFKKGGTQTYDESSAALQDLGNVQISVNGTNTTLDVGGLNRFTATQIIVDASQTLTAAGCCSYITVTGSGTGASRPFQVNGTFTTGNDDVSFNYVGTGATEIEATTYNILSLSPSSATNPTYTLGTAGSQTLTIKQQMQIGQSYGIPNAEYTNPVTINASTWNPAINFTYNHDNAFRIIDIKSGSTYTKGTGLLTFTDNAGYNAEYVITDRNATSQDLGNIKISAGANVTQVDLDNVKATSLTIDSSQIAVIYNSSTLVLTGTSTPLVVNGTFTASTGTVQYTGATATIAGTTYNNLTLGGTGTYTLPAADVTLRGNMVITASANVTKSASNKLIFAKGSTGQTLSDNSGNLPDLGLVQIAANSTDTTLQLSTNIKVTKFDSNSQSLDVNGKTITFTGFGTGASRPFIGYNFSNSSGSAAIYTTTSGTTDVEGSYFDSLQFNGAGNTFNLMGSLVANTVTVTAGTFDLSASNPGAQSVFGNVTIGASGTLKAANSSALSVGGNWTNAGTFNANSGTVNFNAGATGKTITSNGASGAFYNATFNNASGGWTLQDATTVSHVLAITAGNLSAGSQTLTLSGSGTPFVNSDTFTYGTSTVNYTGGSATNITALNGSGSTNAYYNLNLGDVVDSNAVTYTLAGNTTVNNVVTVGNSGSTGTDTFAPSSFTLTLTGSGVPLNFIFGSGDFSGGTSTVIYTSSSGVTNLTSTNLTFSHGFYNLTINASSGNPNFFTTKYLNVLNDLTVTSGTFAVSAGFTEEYVYGNVTGNGVINFTGTSSVFHHAMTGSKNFGGNSDWTFYSLTIGECDTGTSVATGSGAINVTGTLTVAQCDTLSAGSKTWNLSDYGNPFTFGGTGAGTLNAQTSTFVFTGNDPAGNTNIPAKTFNNLTLNNASETYVLTGATSTTGNLTITAGTLDAVSGQNYALSIGGNYTNSGTFTARNGTVTFSATSSGKTITSGAASGKFYDLLFSGSGGGWTLQDNPEITHVLTISNGSLDASSRTITLSGSGTPFVKSGGTFTYGTSTIKYNGTSATNIAALNGTGGTNGYYNLSLGDVVDSNSVTYTLLGNTTVNSVLKVSNSGATGTDTLAASTFTLTLPGNGTPLNIVEGKGTLSAGTSTVVYTSGTGISALTAATGTHYYNLTINGAGTFTMGLSVTVDNDLTVTAGTLSDIADLALQVNGNTTGNGIINVKQLFLYATSSKNFGGNTDWTIDSLNVGEDSSGTITATGSGVINVTSGLVINTGYTLNAGSKTWNLSGTSGAPFVQSGTFNANTSTFNYTGNNSGGNTTVTTAAYYNLTINNASETYVSSAGTLAIGGNLNVSAGTYNLDTNDPTTTVTGNITIDGTLVASSSNTLTVNGNFVNNGTFTHSNGTVALAPTTSSNVDGSSNSTFYNLSISAPTGQNIKFKNGKTFGITNSFTASGSNSGNLLLGSMSPGSQWTINYTGNSLTLNYILVQDSACSGSNLAVSEKVYDGGNNGTCWLFKNFGRGNGNGASGGGSGGGTPPGGGNGNGGGNGGSGGSSGGGPTLPETFTNSDGVALTTHNVSWTINGGNFAINTNAVRSNTSNSDGMAVWNVSSFSNDQYAQVTLSALASGGYIGVTVRGQTGAFSGYGAYSDSNTAVKIIRWDAGTPTVLYTGTAFAASDVLRLDVQGTTLTLKKNGSIVTTVTDSTYSSGRPGLSGFGVLTGTRADDFNAASIAQGGGGGGSP